MDAGIYFDFVVGQLNNTYQFFGKGKTGNLTIDLYTSVVLTQSPCSARKQFRFRSIKKISFAGAGQSILLSSEKKRNIKYKIMEDGLVHDQTDADG